MISTLLIIRLGWVGLVICSLGALAAYARRSPSTGLQKAASFVSFAVTAVLLGTLVWQSTSKPGTSPDFAKNMLDLLMEWGRRVTPF